MVKRNFKKIILSELSNSKIQNGNEYISEVQLTKNISEQYQIKYSNKRLKVYIKRVLKVLESNQIIIRKKNSYSLGKKVVNKKMKRNVKKNINSRTAKINQNILVTPIPNYSIEKKDFHYIKRWPATWQFYDINNFNATFPRADGWYDYDPEASDIVEDEWQRYIINRGMNDVRAVLSGAWQYMVDFVNWKQTNIVHQNHKVRAIRRLCENGLVTLNPYIQN